MIAHPHKIQEISYKTRMAICVSYRMRTVSNWSMCRTTGTLFIVLLTLLSTLTTHIDNCIYPVCEPFGHNYRQTLARYNVNLSCTYRAANNSRSPDNGRPKFANVRRNRNLGRTFCPTNFLLQHLQLSYTLLFRMQWCLCPTKFSFCPTKMVL